MTESVSIRPLVDKLGIDYAMRVAIVHVLAVSLREMLRARPDHTTEGTPRLGTDHAFLGVDSAAKLAALAGLRTRLKLRLVIPRDLR